MKTDLLTIAEAQIAEKQYKEIEALKKRLESDKEVIKRAVELVNSHTLYKRVPTYNYAYKYVLATEEMLKEDYLKEPEHSFRKGIAFLKGDSSRPWNTGVLSVNGEIYYDIHFALEGYERKMNDKVDSINRLNQKIQELKDGLESMEREFPTLKQAITEWQEYQKKETDDYCEKTGFDF